MNTKKMIFALLVGLLSCTMLSGCGWLKGWKTIYSRYFKRLPTPILAGC